MPTTDPDPSTVFVSGIVLAAGASTRMGRPKPLLPLGDRCLLRHVIDAAGAARLDEVVVVLGAAADEIRSALGADLDPRVRLVHCPDASEGQSASLRAGLAALDPRADAAAVLLGDQPEIESATIDAVLAAFLDSERPAARPVYPDAADRPGHPVLLARELFAEAMALHGDHGARTLFAAHPEWLLRVPLRGAPPTDVDTPADLARLRAK